MSRSIINPWSWQDGYGFVQAVSVDLPARMLFVAGQASLDSDGRATNLGDPVAQFLGAIDNLEIVLAEGGATLADVVRLNYYVIDSQHYVDAVPAIAERLALSGCQTASTMLQVGGLATPDLLVEIEATAMVSVKDHSEKS